MHHTNDPPAPVSVSEYQAVARTRLDAGSFDYIAGGAGDEITLHENVAAFERRRLLPRVLADVSRVDAATDLAGTRVAFPVIVAPTAFQQLAHPDGELAMARACDGAGTVMVVSTMASYTMEDIAAAAPGPKWFQLYCYRDRGIVRQFVERAASAGYGAICLTVDLPRVGRRERDIRNRFGLPDGIGARNFDGIAPEGGAEAFSTYIETLVDPSLTWEAVDWLAGLTSLPVVLKGILRSDDAKRAADHGARGLVVSNHGARQLDTVPATIEVLEEIVAAVDGRLPVVLDGGVRRGTDVVKALALGAVAVGIGRPAVWGLAAGGETGVGAVLALLREEVESAMALVGCRTVEEITRDLVR